MRRQRIYVDTSVVLGRFDIDEFRRQMTGMFWQAVEGGEVIAVISGVLEKELENTQNHVRLFLDSLQEFQIEQVASTDESDDLAERYIAEKVVTKNSINDCQHVAMAVVNGVGKIVSWNFRDMVKREKKCNDVNVKPRLFSSTNSIP